MRRLSDYSFILTFIWIGFIMALSFLENSVRYTVPSLNLKTGLDVTKYILGALNKVETVFAVIIIILTVFSKPRLRRISILLFIVVILVIQTIWLLPSITTRANNIIAGFPGGFNYQIVYTISDLIKIVLLFMFGWLQVKSLMRNYLRHI